jgi:hypothetical protein
MEAPSYEIKELAWKECCEVWKALAITGYEDKREAVKWAYKRGKIGKEYYRFYCPFCHYLSDTDLHECKFCLWPGEGYVRCEDVFSPYNNWRMAKTNVLLIPSFKIRNELKKAASRMYRFLLTLKPQKENF